MGAAGGIYAIIGLDGAGKTTVALRICAQLERAGEKWAVGSKSRGSLVRRILRVCNMSVNLR